ncbi:MAG: hypothetical protein JOY68_01425 [Candidatus Dormibacteraeota bacterium]|nr:hypothetical protein [Candidatus Dormibacteraeota bacterium]
MERTSMMSLSPTVRAALLAAAAVALAAAALQLRGKRQMAELTADNIQAQLDALDPVTRAAVITRLTADEVKKVRDQHG